MFEKLMGKRKKEPDFFHIPEKKYTTDSKIIGKMGTGALKDLLGDQEKYVGSLIEKVLHLLGSWSRAGPSTTASPTNSTSSHRKTK
jgi:hypothetical protein